MFPPIGAQMAQGVGEALATILVVAGVLMVPVVIEEPGIISVVVGGRIVLVGIADQAIISEVDGVPTVAVTTEEPAIILVAVGVQMAWVGTEVLAIISGKESESGNAPNK